MKKCSNLPSISRLRVNQFNDKRILQRLGSLRLEKIRARVHHYLVHNASPNVGKICLAMK
jgi:hypothetical protein